MTRESDDARRPADARAPAPRVITRHPLARTPWRTRSSREVYRNPWIRLREDLADMPDGRNTVYGIVECAPCVGVLPFVDRDHVVMVGQYRYVAGDFFWEMPTGAMRPGETEEAAVQRELAEEAGYEAGRLVRLTDFHSSKSVMRESCALYVAEDLRPAARDGDRTEFIEVAVFPFAQVLAMVEAGEIKDAMSVIAVLLAARRRAP